MPLSGAACLSPAVVALAGFLLQYLMKDSKILLSLWYLIMDPSVSEDTQARLDWNEKFREFGFASGDTVYGDANRCTATPSPPQKPPNPTL